MQAYINHLLWQNILLSIVVFCAFHLFIFTKLVKKHTARITQYADEFQYFFYFFDKSSFCVMAFMMSFGIALRVSGLCPTIFIAIFYAGLGASLLLAGACFILNFLQTCHAGKNVHLSH